MNGFINCEVIKGILVPFFGTVAGASFSFFMKKSMNEKLEKALTGFAAGVMIAASVWSLIIPAIELSADMGRLSFIPAAAGLGLGILFLLILDYAVPQLNANSDARQARYTKFSRKAKFVFAVTLHNIPEGMAVGAVYAGWINGNGSITELGAFALSLGIAIQNIPEGAIISMPLRAEGMSKAKSFAGGVISGAVEPIGALITILFTGLIVPVLPYLLSFAAGAMIYVVIDELIPEMSKGKHSNLGTIFFAFGFTVMMILDVALG